MMRIVLMVLVVVMGYSIPQTSFADAEVEKVRTRCQNDEQRRTAYDCECIATAFQELCGQNPTASELQVYSAVMRGPAAKCMQQDKIHAAALGNCGRVYSQYKHLDKGNLGKTVFCQCVADETVDAVKKMNHHNIVRLLKGTTYAFDTCGNKTEYKVSSESAVPSEGPAPVPTLPAGEEISTTEDATYLIILNRNFDLNQLDPVRFAMSENYKPHLNLKYVTPKDFAVTILPEALVKRGAVPPGVIFSRAIEDVPTMAEMYKQAILVKGSGLKDVLREIERVRAVISADYYVLMGEEIYLVPDLPSRL